MNEIQAIEMIINDESFRLSPQENYFACMKGDDYPCEKCSIIRWCEDGFSDSAMERIKEKYPEEFI